MRVGIGCNQIADSQPAATNNKNSQLAHAYSRKVSEPQPCNKPLFRLQQWAQTTLIKVVSTKCITRIRGVGTSHFLACLEQTSETHLIFWHVSKRHLKIAQAFNGFQAWGRVEMRTSSPEGTAEIARLHR